MLFSREEDEKSIMTKDSGNTAESSLLSEISDLRSRLRELEDDTRSSVSSAVPGAEEWSNLLKKELAKVENEKAKLEMEYMNHMTSLAVSNQKVVDDLSERLKKSEQTNEILEERLATQNGGDKENGRLRKVLEDEREAHRKEINQIQENLAQADHEIVESRQELDYLHEQIVELESDKEGLFQDLTNARKSVEETAALLQRERDASKRTTDRLEKQLAEKEMDMNRTLDARNDAIIQLDAQVTELQQQLDNGGQSGESVEDEVRQLENRLERFQIKLTEKDDAVESLTNALLEEKEKSKSLKKELKSLRGDDNVTVRSGRTPSRTGSGASTESYGSQSKVSSMARVYDSKAHAGDLANSAATVVLQRALEKEKEAVSSLEAQLELEKEIGTTTAADLRRAEKTITTLQTQLEAEQDTSEELRKALDDEREIVGSLKLQLANEQDSVSAMQGKLPGSSSDGEVEKLRLQLSDKEMELGALSAKVSALEMAHDALSDTIRARQDDLEKSENARKETEDKMAASEAELTDLRAQLESLSTMNAMEEEKKSEQGNREITRLRAQVGSLQPELDRAKMEMEVIQRENDGLKKSLRDEQVVNMEHVQKQEKAGSAPKGQRKFDAELNTLKVELTKAQIARAELETESMTKIKELETELEALETEAEEELEILGKEVDSLKQDVENRDAEIKRIEHEKAQLCLSMNTASSSRKDEMEEMQAELIEITSKSARQAREVEALKMKVEDYENRSSFGEGKLRARITELEDEIEKSSQSHRSQANKTDLDRYRSENLKLRESVRQVNAERRSLQEKLDELKSDRHLSKSTNSLKERNASLKRENDKLNKRLKKMENSVTRFAV